MPSYSNEDCCFWREQSSADKDHKLSSITLNSPELRNSLGYCFGADCPLNSTILSASLSTCNQKRETTQKESREMTAAQSKERNELSDPQHCISKWSHKIIKRMVPENIPFVPAKCVKFPLSTSQNC